MEGKMRKDSGVCWAAAVACCVANFLTLGFSYSAGFYYIVFSEVFSESPAAVSLIASINLGTLGVIGPIMSVMVTRLGPGLVMFFGAILTSLGLALSSFASNIFWLYVTFGVMSGAGIGFVCQATIVAMPMFFEKYRSSVSGANLAAGGIGSFVYPYLIPFFIDMYRWKGSLLLFSALTLHVCPAGLIVHYALKSGKPTPAPRQCDCEAGKTLMNESCKACSHNTTSQKDILFSESTIDERSPSFVKVTCILFRDVRFLLIMTLIILFKLGSSIAFTFLASYAQSVGVSYDRSKLLLSIMGGSSTAGRLLLGLFGQLRWVDPVIVTATCYVLGGVGLASAAVFPSYAGCMFCAALFGFCYAASAGSPVYEIMCRMFDTRIFSLIVGYSMLVNGFGIIAGSPIGGIIYEETSYFGSAFYLAGAFCAFSGLVGYVLYIYDRCSVR